MDYFEELCRWTDCKVTVLANGRAAVIEPADDSESAWMLFQEVVEEIQDELGGDPNFEVEPHPHVRGLPGRPGRPVYDEVKGHEGCVGVGRGTEPQEKTRRLLGVVWLLCRGSNSEQVPLYRTAISTPHRLECASRSSAVCGWPFAVARPGLLGTPGLPAAAYG